MLLPSLLLGLSTTALAAQTTRYLALVDGGKQAGHQIVNVADDGTTTVDYIFKDNGRGPELKETYTLGKDGTYQTYTVQGTSTFGAKVDESFKREGAQARWKSLSDSGEIKLDGAGLYSPLGGTPAGVSVMINALNQRSDGKLPLLPVGTLSMSKLAQAQV
ncbi:amidohydrolase, partial [Lysobacter sp. 2RAB21]